MGIGEVSVHLQPHAIPVCLVIIERQVQATRFRFTHIGTHLCRKSHCRRYRLPIHQDISTVFRKIVGLDIQSVEQCKFYAIIRFVGFLPSDITVIITPHGHTVLCIIEVRTEIIALAGIVCIHLGKIEETVVFVTNRIISDQTIGIFQLKLGKNLFQWFPELLVRNVITDTDSREETVTFRTVKAFRTVVPEVKLSHIAIVECISKTAG